MKVYLNEITGVADALVSLLMSKRTWTREKEIEIRKMTRNCLTEEGFLKPGEEHFLGEIDKIIKYGVEYGHTTLLRYIDLSYTVEGLHRGGQDDFDAHAARLNSRIVRASTRLAQFKDNEKSQWYEDKILFPFEVCQALGIEMPQSYEHNGKTFILTDYGYIDQRYIGTKTENDVKRGLYPLSIPSNFIFKAQLPEFAHIVQHRDKETDANPELIDMIEIAKDNLTEAFEPLGMQLTKIKMQRHP